jgi:hypothetical protein
MPRFTDPSFPHIETMKRIIAVVGTVTPDADALMGLCMTLGCYAARWIKMSRGETLSRPEWIDYCMIAYRTSNDETAQAVLATGGN